MKNLSVITAAYTHGSVFHADDVFSTAFLRMVNPGIKVIRINSKELVQAFADMDDVIAFDIGEGEYDHHQTDRQRRPIEDGYFFDKDGTMQQIPYCAFGLLWRDYGRLLCPADKAWAKLDRELVLPIDKCDNGVDRNLLSSAIGQFNPNWNEDGSDDARFTKFMQAVEMAQGILQAYVARVNAEVEAEDAVLGSEVVDGNILVLDRYLPWQDIVINQMPDILYVIYPSNRGGFNVQTVPDAPGSFNGRKLFPVEWLGNPDRSLGMTFCHPGNFLLATETLDRAVACARIAASK